jgi:hypothetical protein
MKKSDFGIIHPRVLLLILLVLMCLWCLPATALQTEAHRVTVKFQLQNNGCSMSKLVILLPLPQSNMYQEILNLSYGANGELFRVNGGTDLYVRYLITSNLPGQGTSTLATVEYDVILKEVSRPVDSTVPTVAYNRNDPDFIKFTAANLPYIDPAERRITTIANTLWQEAGQIPLTYARKAYEYVATHYRYLNANTGIHPLTELLDNGGGDCGNLSSIYISLLRAKGIPARHLIAKSVGNNGHAWAEFMLEGFGWVPVDVTYKQGDPRGNYFGRHAYSDKYVVLTTDLNLGVEMDRGVAYTAGLLQNFLWQVWSSGQTSLLVPSLSTTSRPSTVNPDPSLAKIGTIKVTKQETTSKVTVDMGEIYVYSMLDQKIAFSCSLYQNNTFIPNSKIQVNTDPLRWDPGYWGENAYTFTYDLNTIRQQADNSKPVDVVASIVNPVNNKVLGSKKDTLSLLVTTIPTLNRDKYTMKKIETIKRLDPQQLVLIENQNQASKTLTAGIYTLKAKANGNFVCADSGGNKPLIANKSTVSGSSEKFQLVDRGNGKWAIKALVNNKFVCADNTGNSPLIANRAAVGGTWEQFIITDCGDGFFSLKAEVNGQFVCADNAGASALIANRAAAGDWEKFAFIKQ